MKDRILALAGLAQAAKQVRQIADTGQAETAPLTVCIDSLFHFDAESTEAVYGGVPALQPGLALLVDGWGGSGQRDPALLRLVYSVLQLERRFSAAIELIPREGARAIRELTLLQVEALSTVPSFATAIGEAVDAFRKGRDATRPLLRARRVLSGDPSGASGLSTWSGGW